MKKILSLLTVAVLTSSSVASSTAFTTKKIKAIWNQTDKEKADAIKNKIKNINIIIRGDDNLGGSISAYTTKIINAALKKSNPTLTDNDLQKMFYFGVLKLGVTVNVTTDIIVGEALAQINLKVTWLPEDEYIQTIYYNVHESNACGPFGNYATLGIVKMRLFITKENILWAYGGRSWSHFFANLYTHIAIYHPEVGYTAGVGVDHGRSGVNYIGWIFDKNTLDTGNNASYCYSIFASDYWAWSSNKYDFMGDIDLDSHNGYDGGYHGVYADNLIRAAKSTPKDKNGISFQMTFNLHTEHTSYQELDMNSIAYW